MRSSNLRQWMCALLLATSLERYNVNVKRIERNLYQDTSSKAIIETRLCLELALGEDAILQWEGRYGDNWLLFVGSGTKCDVIALR
jgi:hypothetical protein